MYVPFPAEVRGRQRDRMMPVDRVGKHGMASSTSQSVVSQRRVEVSRSVPKCPEVSRSVPNYHELSRNIPKCLEVCAASTQCAGQLVSQKEMPSPSSLQAQSQALYIDTSPMILWFKFKVYADLKEFIPLSGWHMQAAREQDLARLCVRTTRWL